VLLDTENNRMPNAWKIIQYSNHSNPTDANLITVDKIYPNIEIYLNSLVEKITVMKIQLFNQI